MGPAEIDHSERTSLPQWAGTLATQPFWWWLSGIGVSAWIIRIIAVLGSSRVIPAGDAFVYFHSSQLLVEGKGWINAPQYIVSHGAIKIPAASFPPLFTVFEMGPHVVGLHTFLETRLWCTVLGVAAVVVIALVGRAIAGPVVGLVAGAVAAVYPNLWIPNSEAMSEAMTPLLVAWILLMAYRFWKRPSYASAIWLGVAMGVSILGRDELGVAVVLIFLPLAFLAPGTNPKSSVKFLATGALCVVLVLAPWVGYNLSRFDRPTYVSTGLGVTLLSANCHDTWFGSQAGYWSLHCVIAGNLDTAGDESVQGEEAQAKALHFVTTHLSSLPRVSYDRVGRSFGFFRPAQQIRLDSVIEGRPYRWAMVGLYAFYALFALGVVAAWVLRRSRILQFPLWAFGAISVITTLLSFGQTRYRITFEVPLVLLASVTLVFAASALRARRAGEDWKPRPAVSRTERSD